MSEESSAPVTHSTPKLLVDIALHFKDGTASARWKSLRTESGLESA